MKIFQTINLDEIIKCLSQIARILHNQPKKALAELRKISQTVDNQIPYYDGHMQRVTEYSLDIGRELGLSDGDLVTLEAAGLLHDFGKIAIDEVLLLKPVKLSPAERAEIQQHVIKGYYILSGFEEFGEILIGIRHHHEFWDGSGYPEGLTGDSISLIGRILTIADSYDAMTSERPYRKAKTRDYAIIELLDKAGIQFDPDLVEIFLTRLARK
jgi:HD-GYP domain-containing protein (c-di-GMP phosphodiesterase class II)